MASTSESSNRFMRSLKHFPPVINGRINVIEFLAAASDIVALVDRLGTIFQPVKLDMQGNIDKIKKFYDYDETSCLLELMLEEKARGKPNAGEGILWLNRGLLFFELIFMDTANDLRSGVSVDDVDIKKIITSAYENSTKMYHNWVTQQLFNFICKMGPTLSQTLKLVEEDDPSQYLAKLDSYHVNLHAVRCKIDEFFRDNDILDSL